MIILTDLPVVGLQIFEIISKTWSPNPGFLKYFQKHGVQLRDLWNIFKNLEVQILVFWNIYKNLKVQILDFWNILKNMMSKSLTSTQIQDWDQSMVFEMVYLLVQKVFENHNSKGDADTQQMMSLICKIDLAGGRWPVILCYIFIFIYA